MHEKVLLNKKNGMAVMLLSVLFYAAAIVGFVFPRAADRLRHLAVDRLDSLPGPQGAEAPGSAGLDPVRQICGNA